MSAPKASSTAFRYALWPSVVSWTRLAVLHIVHKGERIFAVAAAYEPGNDKLAVAVQSGPRPHITSAFDRLLHG